MTELPKSITDKLEHKIANLSPAKRAILEQKLQQKNLADRERSSISRRSNRQEYSLSFSQQRMWFLDRLKPGNTAYNRPANIRFTGNLNVAVLERSLNEIIRRHEVLRTNFPLIEGEPKIAIVPQVNLSLPVVDFFHLPADEQQEKVEKLAIQEAQTSFDLATDVLVRAILIGLKDEEHILLLTFHHIIFDGWSMEILLKELAVIYEAFSSGKPSPLPELTIQYADFAYWQRQKFQREEFASGLAYWRQQLGGKLPILELPTDKQRSPIQTFNGARYELNISSALTTDIKRLSQQEGATLFMTLLAAFQLLLYRYTGQEDIIIGSLIAGRDHLEIENQIGVFINTLALRTQLTANLTFKELLVKVKQIALDAYKHQDVPFEKLVEELQPERDLSHTPIFQVLFQLRNIPKTNLDIKGLKIEEFKSIRGLAAFDLYLDICEKNSGLSCLFGYNTDLFESATIGRMAWHFETLLKGIIISPEQPIYQLPLLTDTERHQLLVESNNTKIEYSQDKCIHQLFEERVTKNPNAVALVFEEQQLTYQELNQKANRLANYLQRLGVKPEDIVGICLERSIDLIIALLAVLKAGGAYLPLDPNYPVDRSNYIVNDARISVLIVKQQLSSIFVGLNVPLLEIDREIESIEKEEINNLTTTVTRNNLAYVIYTSGSTGKPKGVALEHKALINFTQAAKKIYNLQADDRILQFASISFDAAVEEVYPCLTAGATLVLRNEEMLVSAAKFISQSQAWGITIWDLPTAYWHQLISAIDAEKLNLPESLRLVIIGGEKVLADKVKLWQQSTQSIGNSPPLLINTYGPTEGTVVTTAYSISPNTITNREIPIGTPLDNVKCFVLDANLQPLPRGAVGELHIGGASLARGYLHQPDLTAQKFIANPFDPSQRLYKTGDRVRYLGDGNLEFLGRIDNQVKIRGFRLELGEIEAVLSQHPQVKSVTVIDKQDESRELRLLAYIVPQTENFDRQELRNFLARQLPDYAIPSLFITLDSLPLTPNGKVDRLALPTPDLSQRGNEIEFIAPRTPVEQTLAQIWSEVLKIEKIGVEDNFFALGGHSLLAAKVVSRLSQSLGVDISLRNLFESPTIALLSRQISANLAAASQINSTEYEEGEI